MNVQRECVPAERQEKILSYIRTHGSGQIKELSGRMGVSEATVRRDLDALAEAGCLERTHGGAIRLRDDLHAERRFEEKRTLMSEEKKRIAAAAARFIAPGDSVFLDSGSTSYYLGCEMSEIPDLTVFTYDLMVAYSIPLHPTSEMIVTGGVRRHGFNNVLLGDRAVDLLRGLRIDKVFLGADAVDMEFGVSNSTLSEAEIKAQAVRGGKTVYLMADHTKVGKCALAKVCGLESMDVVITDVGAAQRDLERLRERVGRVVVV